MAAIDWLVANQTARQTLTGAGSDTYGDVSGAAIPSSSFVGNGKYLIIVTAQLDGSNANGNFAVQTVHGSTAFPESEFVYEPAVVAPAVYNYVWWTVFTQPASPEDIKLQFKTLLTTHEVGLDAITVFAMRLDLSLTENTDWLFNENNTETVFGLANEWTTTNNAAITFTPETGGQRWLVLSRSRTTVANINATQRSRINRSGEASSTLPEMRWRGTDLTDRLVMSHVRVFTLGAASNTFTEQSNQDSATSPGSRTHSGIFALNLDKFSALAEAYTEAALTAAAAVQSFGDELQSVSIDLSSISNATEREIFVLGRASYQAGASSVGCNARIQVDNSIEVPGDQTSELRNIHPANGSGDKGTVGYAGVVTGLSAAGHLIDLDASRDTDGIGTETFEYRQLVAFSRGLAGGGGGGESQTIMMPSRNVMVMGGR